MAIYRPRIYLVVEDIRSAHNVGSILRTAEGLGVYEVALCGYTPYPKHSTDDRPPYLADKIHNRISKTSLGAESSQRWQHFDSSAQAISRYNNRKPLVIGLEQTPSSVPITTVVTKKDTVLVVGNEVEGVKQDTLAQCDVIAELPMHGSKESFNVSVATAMALFYISLMLK